MALFYKLNQWWPTSMLRPPGNYADRHQIAGRNHEIPLGTKARRRVIPGASQIHAGSRLGPDREVP